MSNNFIFDERLGIKLPHLEKSWEEYTVNEQQEILVTWEIIRGKIPDRIYKCKATCTRRRRQFCSIL
jgi:hypothetical protein